MRVHAAMHAGLIRTYGDLIDKCEPSSSMGNCCACHGWKAPTWHLSTRANICRACCERKRTETLGSILKAERRVRSWVKREGLQSNPEWLARYAGVSVEFVKAEIAKLRAAPPRKAP